eukprot:scaffold260355_cov16-Prasinocladus_malaysianus.AAC.1
MLQSRNLLEGPHLHCVIALAKHMQEKSSTSSSSVATIEYRLSTHGCARASRGHAVAQVDLSCLFRRLVVPKIKREKSSSSGWRCEYCSSSYG